MTNAALIASMRTDLPRLAALALAAMDIVERWDRYRRGENFNGLDTEKLLRDHSALLDVWNAKP